MFNMNPSVFILLNALIVSAATVAETPSTRIGVIKLHGAVNLDVNSNKLTGRLGSIVDRIIRPWFKNITWVLISGNHHETLCDSCLETFSQVISQGQADFLFYTLTPDLDLDLTNISLSNQALELSCSLMTASSDSKDLRFEDCLHSFKVFSLGSLILIAITLSVAWVCVKMFGGSKVKKWTLLEYFFQQNFTHFPSTFLNLMLLAITAGLFQLIILYGSNVQVNLVVEEPVKKIDTIADALEADLTLTWVEGELCYQSLIKLPSKEVQRVLGQIKTLSGNCRRSLTYDELKDRVLVERIETLQAIGQFACTVELNSGRPRPTTYISPKIFATTPGMFPRYKWLSPLIGKSISGYIYALFESGSLANHVGNILTRGLLSQGTSCTIPEPEEAIYGTIPLFYFDRLIFHSTCLNGAAVIVFTLEKLIYHFRLG